jgi:hypothetical protein
MSKPAPPVATPKTTLVYGYESNAGYKIAWPLDQIRVLEEGSGRPETVTVPNLDGVVDLGGDKLSAIGPQEVEVSFMVVGAALHDTIHQVKRATSLPGKLWRVTPEGSAQWTKARRLGRPRQVTEPGNLAETPWQILTMRFLCPTGVWYAENASSQSFALSGTFDSGVITNPGDYVVKALKFTLQPANPGTIKIPTIRNMTGSGDPYGFQHLWYQGSALDGTPWVLDTSIPSLKKGTADSWSELRRGVWPYHRQGYLWLFPGPNTITISSSVALSGTATLEFYPAYL